MKGILQKYRCDILNLEWATDSRDTNIVDPILFSLHKRYGYKIKCSSIWYFLIKLLWYRPKVLIIANDTGAKINVDAFRFAKMLGVRTITLVSEGLHYKALDPNRQKDFNTELYWGNNFKREVCWDLKLFWSKSLRNEIYRDVPETKNHNIQVTGASGFDKYTLMTNEEIREGFGDEYKQKYKKIILLIGLGFDCLMQALKTNQMMGLGNDEIINKYSMREKIRDVYRYVIEKNSDALFILKHHPGSVNLDDTEFEGLSNYSNTVEFHRGIDIAKLVCLSDVVIAFESTVCMEAWLMGKSTILVNPPGTAFTRSNLYMGSVIVENAETLQELIDEFYIRGTIQEFEELRPIRKNILRSQIQYYDGCNYLRGAKIINGFIKDDIEIAQLKKLLLMELIGELLKELKGIIIEYTPIGLINRNARGIRRRNSSMYNKKSRKAAMIHYGKSIVRFEKSHKELINDICENFVGK